MSSSERERELIRAADDAREERDRALQALSQALLALADYYRKENDLERLATTVQERYALFGRPGCDLIYLADDFRRARDHARAGELLDRVQADFETAGLERNSSEWETFWSIKTELLLALGRTDDAITACRRRTEIARATKSEYSDYWEALSYLADLLQYKKGDIDAALKEREILRAYFRRVINRSNLRLEAASVHVQNSARLAFGYRTLNESDRAIAIYQELLEDVDTQSFYGPSSIDIPSFMIDLAEVHHALGHTDEARTWAGSALEKMSLSKHEDHSLETRAKALL